MFKKAYIFDLDNSVICSKHRQLTQDDGSLNLHHWMQNSTREKIMRDSLLPLAEVMKDSHSTGAIIAVCTSRIMSVHDFEFLEINGLFFDYIMCRSPDDNRPDNAYKYDKLSYFLAQYGLQAKRTRLYDDNATVLEMARRMGIECIDSIQYNEKANQKRISA